jgi:predicted dehydrogenase
MRIYPSLKAAGLDLVAVCDIDLDKARERAAQYGAGNVYSDYEKMCAKHDLDAVLVVTGPKGHYELTRALLKAGYPVWVEKPCAETAEQADELAELSRKTGKHVQVGFNYRYTMGVQRAVDLVRDGEFATPAVVSVRWWLGEPDTHRFMLHYVCHAVDLLHHVTPGGLLHVDPTRDLHIDHLRQDDFDWFIATARGPEGTLAVLELGAQMGGQCHFCRVDMMGRDGMLSVRDFTELTHYDTAPWGDLRKPDSKVYDGDRLWRTEPLLTRGFIGQTFGYIAELERFRETVQGRRDPEATVQEAAWGMHIMNTLEEAARST